MYKLVEARVDYVAGGWPGERYSGTAVVSVNVEADATEAEIDEKLRERAKSQIAGSYVMHRSDIAISAVRITNRTDL